MRPQDQRPDVKSPTGKDAAETTGAADREAARPREIGGPKGLEPTRFGDWERKGRCIDF
ncbi:MAG: DUF1674 domain-containing protein [Gammaproteobacteria bacterium]